MLGGLYLWWWWNRQPSDGQVFLIIAGSVVILSGIAFIVVVWVYRQRQHVRLQHLKLSCQAAMDRPLRIA